VPITARPGEMSVLRRQLPRDPEPPPPAGYERQPDPDPAEQPAARLTGPPGYSRWLLYLLVGLVALAALIIALLVTTDDEEEAAEEEAPATQEAFFILADTYNGEAFAAQYPDEWLAVEQPDGQVIFASTAGLRDRLATGEPLGDLDNSEVAIIVTPLATQSEPPAILQDNLPAAEDGEITVGEVQTTTIDDRPAAHVFLFEADGAGGRIRILLAVDVEGQAYLLEGLAPPDRQEDLMEALLAMAATLEVV
jgi:hypothetical protein